MVLIYGILQTLAGIAVDTPGIKYGDNFGYHRSARPSWCRKGGLFADVKHEMSHCWVAPQTWDEQEGEGAEEDDEFPQDMSLPSPRIQFGVLSPTASETRKSVHAGGTSIGHMQGAYAYRRSVQAPVLLDLPSRRRDFDSLTRTMSSPSINSLRPFLSVDE